MGRFSTEKGRRGERILAKELRNHGFEGAHRGAQHAGKAKGGDDAPDVLGLPGIHIECKFVEKLNVRAAMDQSIADAEGTGNLPTVMHKTARAPWLVTMTLDDWIKLYKGRFLIPHICHTYTRGDEEPRDE